MKRQFSPKRKTIRHIRWLNAKIIAGLLAIVFWASSRTWVYARNLECYTQYGPCDQTLVQGSSWLMNTPLLFPLPQKKLQNVYLKFPQVKQAKLYRRLPSTLVVRIDLRKPIGAVGPDVLGVNSLADEEGIIVGQQQSLQLPHLLVDGKFSSGEQLPASQSLALKVLSSISLMVDAKTLGKIDNSQLSVMVSDTTRVLFDLDQMPSNWDKSLQLILDRSKIRSKVPKIIDLRYSSPILTY